MLGAGGGTSSYQEFEETDLIILWRAALAAALGLLIGWERRVTGPAIEGGTIGLAALTAASLTPATSER